MINNNLINDLLDLGGLARTAVPTFFEREQSLPQGPAATARPSATIKLNGFAKCHSRLTTKQCPCNGQIARRISYTYIPEVNDSAKLAVLYQQVACTHISVDPNR